MPAKPEFDLKSELGRLPDTPGVYRMLDATGELIYVGKAASLKKRVKSYFQKTQAASGRSHTPKVQALVENIASFDYIVTDTEIEALILEANLIKQFQPRYNILLRDDKKYPWLMIADEPFPRLLMVRDPERLARKGRKKPKTFGPYANVGDMYEMLHAIRKHFPLRQRRKPLFKNRPCMNYDIGACLGPCQNLVSKSEYDEVLKQVELFLKGKTDDLLADIERDMQAASNAMQFERAARLRDRYTAVENIIQRQKVFSADSSLSQDVVALASDDLRCAITVLNIRQGKLIGSRAYDIALKDSSTPEEAYESFLNQYYQDVSTEDLPDEVLVEVPLETLPDISLLATAVLKRTNRTVEFTAPQKGVKKSLLAMGHKNAKEALEKTILYESTRMKRDPARALLELQEALGLPDFPERMECYDISHFQGSHTVASMVVFINGVPDKQAYRRFKIKTAEGKPDDFKSMEEVIARRFAHAGKESEKAKSGSAKADSERWPDPDLVIIDGGKGQLSAALQALEKQAVDSQPIISLAKKFEEVYLPSQSRPVLLSRDSMALFLLQQIRDEAHRFAVSYHRSLREKASTESGLDAIPGVGEKSRQKLLTHFGSLQKVKKASVEELQQVLGKRQAQAVYTYFQ